MDSVFYFLLGGYAFITLAWMMADWFRTRDVFYPSIYLMPQLMYFNFVLPLSAVMSGDELFEFYGGGWGTLVEFQLVAMAISVALLLGIRLGSRVGTNKEIETGGRSGMGLYAAGCFMGGIGALAWGLDIATVGGLTAAYGRAYGGGWSDIGYFREASLVGVAAAPMIFLARFGKKMRLLDWGVILMSAAPLIIQGLLGARRGPTFLALAVVVGGYLFFRRKKISLILVIPGGLFVGVLLLFLVANRDAIYIGSDKPLDFSFSQSGGSKTWEADEYILGDAMLRYSDEEGSFLGLRVLTRLVVRIYPSALWPNKYEDARRFLGLNTDLTRNAGVPLDGIAGTVGWMPAPGSAPSLVGDLCLEFGWFAPLVSLAIGAWYGSTWKRSRESLSRGLSYLLLVAFSVYLVAQGIEPWIFRWLFFGVPAVVIVNFAKGRLSKGWVGKVAPSRPDIRSDYQRIAELRQSIKTGNVR
jgi:hypothetical protein